MFDFTWVAWKEIITNLILIASGIGGAALIITKITRVNQFVKKCKTKLMEERVNSQMEYALTKCPIPPQVSAMGDDITRIREDVTILVQQTALLKSTTTSILGRNLLIESKHHINNGWIPPIEKEQILHDFFNYYFSGGNGNVYWKVSDVLNLPKEPKGEPFDIDIKSLIEVEKEKRLKILGGK
jgi:hypothetical protein